MLKSPQVVGTIKLQKRPLGGAGECVGRQKGRGLQVLGLPRKRAVAAVAPARPFSRWSGREGPVSKMATSNFLDDVLNAEPDAAVVSALVGSLESQLSSTTSASSDVLLIDANHSTNSVNSNSINASTNHAFRTATAASPAASAASSVAISASVSALAGNGLSGHAVSSTPIPGTAVLTSTNCNSIPATHTGSAPPAPTSSAPTPTHQQQHINSVHSLLPNGNPTGIQSSCIYTQSLPFIFCR